MKKAEGQVQGFEVAEPRLYRLPPIQGTFWA
jgi:hypothetical protein